MNNWIFLMVIIASMILVIGGFAVNLAKKQRELRKLHPGYPEGYFQGRGMGVGIAIGASLGLAMDNIAIGVGVGVAIGAAIGTANEKKHIDEIRPLTKEERQLKKQKIMFLAATFMLGLLVFVIAYLINR